MNPSDRPRLSRLPNLCRSPVAPFAVLALAVLLTSCGQPAWDGTGVASCPALPLDVVAEVAEDLAADGKGPERMPHSPEVGSLSGSSSNVLEYLCQWPSTDGELGLKVSLQDIDPARATTTVDMLRHWEGPELTADDEGYGRADVNSERGEAQWVCGDLTGLAPILSVTIYSPKEGTDPAVDAQRLAEAILEIVEC